MGGCRRPSNVPSAKPMAHRPPTKSLSAPAATDPIRRATAAANGRPSTAAHVAAASGLRIGGSTPAAAPRWWINREADSPAPGWLAGMAGKGGKYCTAVRRPWCWTTRISGRWYYVLAGIGTIGYQGWLFLRKRLLHEISQRNLRRHLLYRCRHLGFQLQADWQSLTADFQD